MESKNSILSSLKVSSHFFKNSSSLFFQFLKTQVPEISEWILLCDERFDAFQKKNLSAVHFQNKGLIKLGSISWKAAEGEKKLKTIEGFAKQFVQLGAHRNTGLIALGGGLVLDLAGLLASLYYRGIPWIAVPTTLLAQGDSCLGGKTGVNLGQSGKNLLGTFYPPRGIVCDPGFLNSLSERSRVSGLVELLKCGLLFDRSLFLKLKKLWENQPFSLPPPALIHSGLVWKARCVASDPHETQNKRVFLNLGHTLGHALETLTRYKIFEHGEAVLWGLEFALQLSQLKNKHSKELQKAQIFLKTLPRPPLPHFKNGIEFAKYCLPILKQDKKNTTRQTCRFVLIQDLGKNPYPSDFSFSEIEDYLTQFYH